MAANTLSVYVKSPLYEQAKEAQDKGEIKINEIVAHALAQALAGESKPDVAPSVAPAESVPEISLAEMQRAQALADEATQFEYVISYSNDMIAAQAFLDHIASQGAWPISVVPDQSGQFCFLVGWPKVLTEVP